MNKRAKPSVDYGLILHFNLQINEQVLIQKLVIHFLAIINLWDMEILTNGLVSLRIHDYS